MSQNKEQKLEYQGFAEGKDTLHIPPFFDNNCFPKLLTKKNRFQNKKTQNIRQYLNKLLAAAMLFSLNLMTFQDFIHEYRKS